MAHTNSNFIPRRVVSLQPSATVTLQELGLLDSLAACTRWCADVCPAVRQLKIPIIADSWSAQAEEILSARPDLVIASVPYQPAALAEIMKSGARFVGLAPRTFSDVLGDIAVISRIMGAESNGQQVIAEMCEQVEAVRQKAASAKTRPRVYCEEWGKPLISSQAWVAELVQVAGGEFLGEPGVQRLAQAVLEENPDVVIAAWCGAGDRVPLEKIVRSRGWGEMSAVAGNRVYCIRDEFLNTPASTLLDGLRALAWAIHPQIFPVAPGIRQITPGYLPAAPMV
jgi:iron complex transport system substrate-binding protein